MTSSPDQTVAMEENKQVEGKDSVHDMVPRRYQMDIVEMAKKRNVRLYHVPLLMVLHPVPYSNLYRSFAISTRVLGRLLYAFFS